jgi:hemolysin activation/secretion protein
MKLSQRLALTAIAGLLCTIQTHGFAQASNAESETRSQAEARRQQQQEQEQRQRLQTGADVRLPATTVTSTRLSAQDALMAKDFVTTRIFAQPQDLKSGVLVFTVVPLQSGSV